LWLRLRGLVDDLVRAVNGVAQHDGLAHVTRARFDLAALLALAGLRH
jgi:hypothetical protein